MLVLVNLNRKKETPLGDGNLRIIYGSLDSYHRKKETPLGDGNFVDAGVSGTTADNRKKETPLGDGNSIIPTVCKMVVHRKKETPEGDENRMVMCGEVLVCGKHQNVIEYGYGGAMTGFAANEDLLKHYCKVFDAEFMRLLHPYQILSMRLQQLELRRSIVMNGQMMNYNKYYEQLKSMPEPILPSQLPKVKVNLSEISAYAKKKNVRVYELSEAEKAGFIESCE